MNTSTNRSPEKALSPEKAHELWVRFAKEKDLESLLSLYEADGSIYDLSNNKLLTHPDERREYLAGFLETVDQLDWNLYTASVTYNGDRTVAALRSKWFAKKAAADSGTASDDANERPEWTSENCGSEIVRKQADGSWLIIIDNPFAATSWDAYPEY